jgi:hypothetical protein
MVKFLNTLEDVLYTEYDAPLQIGTTLFYKKKDKYLQLSEELQQIVNKMNSIYESIKNFKDSKTHKDFVDYSFKKVSITAEKMLELPEKNDNPIINFPNTNDTYIIRTTYTGNLYEYCSFIEQQIRELELSLKKKNIFIAVYEIDDKRYSKMLLTNQHISDIRTNYVYLGYIQYLFASEENKNIEHDYFFFMHRETSKIIVLTNNGYLVCDGNLFEENSIYYTLINKLLYFQSNIRSLCCYKYTNIQTGKEYILFSRYTKRELRILRLNHDIVVSLEQVEFFKDKRRDIITYLPISTYIEHRNRELKVRLNDEKVVRSNPALSGKYLDDIYESIYDELLQFESAVSTPYACLYLRPEIDPTIFTKEMELIDKEKITSAEEYYVHSEKQLYEEVNPDEVQEYQKSMRQFFTEISNDKHTEFLEKTGLTKEDCEIISSNYLFGESSVKKPTFFTHFDYELSGKDCELKYFYIPEIRKELDKSQFELYKNRKKPKSNDFKILALRPCLIGKDELINNMREFCRNFYIINSFYDYTSDLELPNFIKWSPFLNKYYIKLLFDRELLFPIIYYHIENKDKHLYFTEDDKKKFRLVGYIQLKLKNNADIIIFIFFNGIRYKLYNFRGNRILLSQGINDYVRWINIELNILYQFSLKNILHIYKSSLYPDIYLFSKKSMDEIISYYKTNGIDKSEITGLQEVRMVKDKNSKLFIQEEMHGGYKDINKIKIDNNKYDNKYDSKLIYDKLKKYFFFKDITNNIFLLLIKESYIRNNIFYYIKEHKIKYDKKILPYIENLSLLLKNKFICWDKNIEFFYILNLLKDKQYKKILSISSNRCCIESIKFYFKDAKITNLSFNKFMYEKSIILINKIKESYIFDDLLLDNINLLENKKFDFIVFDCVYKAQFKDVDYESYDSYIGVEKENASLLNKIKDILKYIIKGGTLYLLLNNFLDETTLLEIQFIRQCFSKCKIISLKFDIRFTESFNFVFEDFIGIVEPLPYLSNKFMKSIKRFYKDFFEELEDYKLRYEMIKSNLDNKEYIKSLKIQNLAYSYKFAQDLGFDVYKNIVIDDSDNSTYGINIKKNDILLQSLQKMFSLDEGVYTVMKNRDKNLQMNIKVSNDIVLPEQIVYYNKLQNVSTRQIDFRPIHIWDETKKFIRYYEHTLNVYLQNYRISIEKTKPVSRAWIKFYELLFVTKIFDNLKGDLKVFHICEAPGTFIMSTIYYLNGWNKNLKYDWDATTLNPKYLSKNGIGDTYDLLKKYKDKWTFGFDGTGDITVEKNIKHYREICKDREFIIGDCGLPWGDDSIPGIVLYYSQMLFILYNLKEGGGCIFKQILNFGHKIIVDMVYLLYYCFDIVKVYKPTQNAFSGEMYIVCTGYKRLLKDSDFDILFKVLDNKKDIHKKSIISEEYKKEFIYQFANTLEKIIVNFNQAIDRQLFYTDFWDLIQHEDKDEIKRYIDIKNKDWVDTYLLKTVVK